MCRPCPGVIWINRLEQREKPARAIDNPRFLILPWIRIPNLDSRLLAGDVDTGKAVLRDYINTTMGFEELSQVFDKSSKSLMRMFGPKGNPQVSNLFAVTRYLQEQEGIHLEVKVREMG